MVLTMTSICNLNVYSYSDTHPNTHINTGDEIADVVDIAISQLGYIEKGDGYTKYGEFRGNKTGGWCNFFVHWVLNEAGIDKSRFPYTNPAGYNNEKNKNLYINNYGLMYHKAGKNYNPQPGDIFITAGHMGIVIDGEYVIHGNWGDAVAKTKLYAKDKLTSNDNITYFITPSYNSTTLKIKDNYTSLTTIEDEVPVRTGPYQSAKKVKTVPIGKTLNAIGEYKNIHNNLWYKLDDGNWVYSKRITSVPSSMVFISTSSSTIKNTKHKNVAVPAPVIVKKTQDYVIPGPAPKCDGYTFWGYSTKEGATKVEYQIGDTIKNVTGNITLYPVWKQAKTTMKLDAYDVSMDISEDKNKIQTTIGVVCQGTLSETDVLSVQSDNKSVVTATCYPSNYYTKFLLWDKETNLITLYAGGCGSANVIVTLKDSKGNIRISQTISVTVNQSYSINFYGPNNTIAKNQTKKYNKNLILSNYIPEKTGYAFMGWSTTNGSSTVEYGPGDLYADNENTNVYSNVNLYPVWQEKYEIRWSISNNILTISGKGDMASYPTGKTPWNSSKNTIKKIVVESGVTSIGSNAFEEFTALTEVTLPYGIVKLGSKAFYNCTSLTKINFPASIKSYGNKVFGNCRALENATIPDTSKLLKAASIDGSDSVEIGAYAFENCISLSSVSIPACVEKVGAGAYSGCTGIETLNISNGVTEIDDNAFYDCSSIESVSVPTSVDTVGDGAFSGCSNLNDLSISEGVENIGDQAFSGCSALVSVDLPESTKELGAGIFSACSALEDINLPESLNYIGNAMFSGCSALESIDIPDNVSYIGDGAFRSCSSLEKVDLPKNVNVISNDTFYGCSSLKDITVESSIYSVGDYAFASCNNLKNVIIDEGVSEIGVCSFAFCSSLETVSLPASLTLIDDGAFMECTSLKNIDMVEASVVIGEDAFSGCSALVDFYLPSSVISVGDNAFADCGSLKISCFSNSSVYDQICDLYGNIETLTLVDSVSINDEDMVIDIGSEKTLSASVLPLSATDPSVTWRSDNEYVVTVDNNGNIKAVDGGVATVYVTSNDGQLSDSITIRVNVPVESIKFDYNNTGAYVGEKFSIGYKMYPASPTDIDVEWASSNPSVAIVDENGLVEIVGPGEVDIKIKTSDGGYTDLCSLSCEEYINIQSLNVSSTEMNINIGQTKKMSVSCMPENATNKYFCWAIKEGSDVVSVDDSGNIIGLKEGVAYIYASNGEIESNVCKVTVVDNGSIGIMNMTKFNNTTVAYKSTITFYPEISNVTDIKWVVSGAEGIQNDDGSFTVKKATNDFSIYCTARGVDQTEIKSEVETVHVKHGFFDKLIAFFKGLFGLLPVLYQ